MLEILRNHVIFRDRVAPIHVLSSVSLHILEAVLPLRVLLSTLAISETHFLLFQVPIHFQGELKVLFEKIFPVVVKLDCQSQNFMQEILNQRLVQLSCSCVVVESEEIRQLLLVIEKLLRL